jgi:hypothetical protein
MFDDELATALVERLISIGPAGCPPVAEFAPQGLVGPFDTSTQSARSWLADALTIRHRLPRLWERVLAGEVHHWKARQIATLTGQLSVAVVGAVDEQTSPWVEQLPWQTFLKTLDATMLQVDETSYRERERLAAAKREVRATPSEAGLRTLIARGEAGDVAMLLALYQRVAECLAEEGDEDPLPVRLSKAIGWIAQPARLNDLLARHAGDPDPHRQPWEQVAAHAADPTDPWADELPPAGWETAEHGNYHQPGLHDDTWWDQPRPDEADWEDWPADPPLDPDDLDWYHRDTAGAGADRVADQDRSAGCRCDGVTGAEVQARWPEAFRRPGWRPLTRAQLAACAPTVIIHVHLSEATLRDNHGVVRTDAGPILLEQLHRFVVQHDANIKVYPVVDPAETAPADSYEIPLRLRRAMQIRHPRSVFPHSPVRQPARLGPHPRLRQARATRTDRDAQSRTPGPQRAPTQDRRKMAFQTTRTRHLPVAITRRLDRGHHQPRHPRARTHRLGHPTVGISCLITCARRARGTSPPRGYGR